MSTLSPTSIKSIASLWFTPNSSSLPLLQVLLILIVSPILRLMPPFSNFNVRNSGPLVSYNKATGRFVAFLTSRILSIVLSIPSSVAWLKLILAQFMPSLTIFSMTSAESDAGPIVHMTFVFFTISPN